MDPHADKLARVAALGRAVDARASVMRRAARATASAGAAYPLPTDHIHAPRPGPATVAEARARFDAAWALIPPFEPTAYPAPWAMPVLRPTLDETNPPLITET